jgi:hypothetical protein
MLRPEAGWTVVAMRRAEGVRGDVEPAVDAPEGSGALVDQARPFAERAGTLAGKSVVLGAIATRVGTTHWKSPRELLTVDAIRHAFTAPETTRPSPKGRPPRALVQAASASRTSGGVTGRTHRPWASSFLTLLLSLWGGGETSRSATPTWRRASRMMDKWGHRVKDENRKGRGDETDRVDRADPFDSRDHVPGRAEQGTGGEDHD